MKAIVFLDGQIAEGYGNLKCDGILPFTKEMSTLDGINGVSMDKTHFTPKVKLHGFVPSEKKNGKRGKKAKMQRKYSVDYSG